MAGRRQAATAACSAVRARLQAKPPISCMFGKVLFRCQKMSDTTSKRGEKEERRTGQV